MCSGTSLTLTATGASSYTWSPASTLSSSTASLVTATPVITTTYTLLGANGICTNSTTQVINVIASPAVSITPTATNICLGMSSTLTADFFKFSVVL